MKSIGKALRLKRVLDNYSTEDVMRNRHDVTTRNDLDFSDLCHRCDDVLKNLEHPEDSVDGYLKIVEYASIDGHTNCAKEYLDKCIPLLDAIDNVKKRTVRQKHVVSFLIEIFDELESAAKIAYLMENSERKIHALMELAKSSLNKRNSEAFGSYLDKTEEVFSRIPPEKASKYCLDVVHSLTEQDLPDFAERFLTVAEGLILQIPLARKTGREAKRICEEGVKKERCRIALAKNTPPPDMTPDERFTMLEDTYTKLRAKRNKESKVLDLLIQLRDIATALPPCWRKDKYLQAVSEYFLNDQNNVLEALAIAKGLGSSKRMKYVLDAIEPEVNDDMERALFQEVTAIQNSITVSNDCSPCQEIYEYLESDAASAAVAFQLTLPYPSEWIEKSLLQHIKEMAETQGDQKTISETTNFIRLWEDEVESRLRP